MKVFKQIGIEQEKNKVKIIDTKNEFYNPMYHEIVEYRDSNIPKGFILQTINDGYMVEGKVICAAKVIVSSGKI